MFVISPQMMMRSCCSAMGISCTSLMTTSWNGVIVGKRWYMWRREMKSSSLALRSMRSSWLRLRFWKIICHLDLQRWMVEAMGVASSASSFLALRIDFITRFLFDFVE